MVMASEWFGDASGASLYVQIVSHICLLHVKYFGKILLKKIGGVKEHICRL